MNKNVFISILGTLLLFNILFIVFFKLIRITSDSMEKTLKKGDLIIVYKTKKSIRHGDIISFKLNDKSYIKRCIAGPKDTVTIEDFNFKLDKVYVNSHLIKEEYLNNDRGIEPFLDNKIYFTKGYIVPYNGYTIKLTSDTFRTYGPLINQIEYNSLHEKEGKYYYQNNVVESYTFRDNFYYLMGDNRSVSRDSRYYGAIPEDYIFGKIISF